MLLGLLASALVPTIAKAQQDGDREDEAYLSPSAPTATGKAPGMKVQLLADKDGIKSYVLVFAKGDEVFSGISDFARQNKVGAASFTAIGAFSDATVAWFDRSRKEYKLIPIDEQVELISMVGDIALSGDQPVVHTHVALATSFGAAKGGHLIEAHVFPTVELFLTAYPTPLRKLPDDTTDLKLIDPSVK